MMYLLETRDRWPTLKTDVTISEAIVLGHSLGAAVGGVVGNGYDQFVGSASTQNIGLHPGTHTGFIGPMINLKPSPNPFRFSLGNRLTRGSTSYYC